MSLYDRLKALLDTITTPAAPKTFNIATMEEADGTYQIGISEGRAPMPAVGLGSAPTHQRDWSFRLEVLTKSTEANLETFIENVFSKLESASLINGMYEVHEIGTKTERYGMKCVDIYGTEKQLVNPGSAF